MRKEIEDWWKQAQADIKAARNCITARDYYLAVFSCQQSVEKALKALCLLKIKEIPRGHSILYLSQKMKIPRELESGIRDLNPEYLITRYPDMASGVPAEMYDKDIAEKHYSTAQRVIQWVEKQMHE